MSKANSSSCRYFPVFFSRCSGCSHIHYITIASSLSKPFITLYPTLACLEENGPASNLKVSRFPFSIINCFKCVDWIPTFYWWAICWTFCLDVNKSRWVLRHRHWAHKCFNIIKHALLKSFVLLACSLFLAVFLWGVLQFVFMTILVYGLLENRAPI